MIIKSKAKVLSIAINNEYIKICEMTKSGKNIIVHKAVTVPTPDRCYSDGMIRDRGILAKKIKIALDDHRISTSATIFSLASTKIATKEVLIPNVRTNKIADIINTNATEYFPVNIEEYIIQYSILEQLEDNKTKVLVMATPSEMVEAYYDLASSLGLTIEAIDYVGNSTYQALRAQIDEAPSIVIQIENDTTIINIFNNNVLQLQRTVPYGKSVIVNAIMDSQGIKYDPALKLLQSETMVHSSFDGDIVTDSLRYLISNVNRIVDYYTTRDSNEPIEKAYVIGNATTIKGLVELFAHELNLPLVNIDKLKNVADDKKTYVDEGTLTSYITNIGAVIAPVNFVPKNILATAKSRDDGKTLKFILMASIIGGAVLVVIPFIMMSSTMSYRDMLQKDVDQLKSVETIVAEYYNAKDLTSDVLTFKKLTVSNNDELEGFITSLETVMPSDVSIKSMTISDGAVTMNGVSSSKVSLALLIQNLNGINNVSSVTVSNESESKDSSDAITTTFSLTCAITNANN